MLFCYHFKKNLCTFPAWYYTGFTFTFTRTSIQLALHTCIAQQLFQIVFELIYATFTLNFPELRISQKSLDSVLIWSTL